MVDEIKSGKLTQYVMCDSESLSGTPLIVTLILVPSDPLILIPEYPIPLPASDVIYRDGVIFKIVGIS